MPPPFSELPILSELAGLLVLNCRLPDMLVVPGMSTSSTTTLPEFVMPKHPPKFGEMPNSLLSLP
jgi:hypothetical protein